MQKRIVGLFQVNVISVGKLDTLSRHASHLERQMRIQLNKNRIDSKGLHKTKEKISAIDNAPVPKNVHEVKSFLGLVNFYGKFCENLAAIANPLNNLTKKNVRFLWSMDCQVAFEQIKKEICSPKVLVYYDPSLPLILASDASPVGIGCVLSHVYPDGSVNVRSRSHQELYRHAETAEDISKDPNKELGSSSVQGVPSTDVAVPDLSQSSAKETDSETRSPPVPDRPFPRRSGRIRRPPDRLVL
ncbi:transposon Tf2-9 polyprotein [Trichonephila clavata]|uniref:RNA-directed DNA polymerase n=1 Tax=Trichonephila clavata TaxID=2740835 RepID=A0A8X6KAZ6_TRICU|nr:transposon Tf2-9 polyprotein [Trichonephila clavata]